MSDIDFEPGRAVDPFHELKDRDALNDHRQRRCNTALDDAVDLVVKVNEIVLGRDHKKIGFDQRNVELPREISSERCLPHASAAIDRNDDARQTSQDWRERFDGLRVRRQYGGHGGTLCCA